MPLNDSSSTFTGQQLEKFTAVMHAYWLAAYDTQAIGEVWERRAADLLRITYSEFWSIIGEMDNDWADRVFCSRPTNWKPADSLAKLQK